MSKEKERTLLIEYNGNAGSPRHFPTTGRDWTTNQQHAVGEHIALPLVTQGHFAILGEVIPLPPPPRPEKPAEKSE